MMQLKRVRVNNFRKFITATELKGLQTGLNIVAGDNEHGKSTFVHAIKAALYTKHNSTATSAFQPYGSAALPEIEIDFELAGVQYSLHKRLGKKGSAELRSEKSIFQGSEAEEKLEDLLQLGKEKRTNSSIWNILWVDQGTTFGALELGETGRRTLSDALSNELGRLVSGDQGQVLLSRIRQLYLKWFTETGRHSARSEYSQAQKEWQEILPEFEKAQSDHQLYESTLKELEETKAALAEFDDKQVIDECARQVEAARQQADGLQKLQADLERRKAQVSTTEAQYKTVSAAWQARRDLQKQFEDCEKLLVDLEEQIAQKRAQFDESAKQLHDAQQQETTLDAQYESSDALCRNLEALAQLSALQTRCRQLENNFAKSSAAQSKLEQLEKKLETLKVDRAALDRLKTEERRLIQMRAQLEAIATKIQFQPEKGQTVARGQEAIDTANELLITEPSTFTLSGWGAVTIVPGGEELEKKQEGADRLADQLTRALKHLYCESMEDAELKEQERARNVQETNECLRDIERYAPAGIAALGDELAMARAEYDQCLAQLQPGNDAGDDPATASERLKKERLHREQIKKQLASLRANIQLLTKALNDTTAQVQSLTGQQQALQSQRQATAAKLAQEREKEPDSQLDQRMTEARVQHESARSAVEQLQAEFARTNPESVQSAIKAAQDELERKQRQVQELRERKSSLLGSLQTFGKAGISEEFARLCDRKEKLEAQCKRLLERSEAIKLLFDTLTASEARNKKELAAPLAAQLNPYLHSLFGGAQLEIDSNGFFIQEVGRQGQTEPYDNLSIGTREQISVITRLAFAQVLAANNYPSVVILDDALVYSDEMRLQRMQEILQEAAQQFQILIFTCRRRDWEGLNAAYCHLNSEQPLLALRSDS